MTDERRNGTRRENDQMIEQRLSALESGHGRMLEVLMGPLIIQPDGTQKRRSEQGMAERVERIEKRLSNGGVKVKLPPAAWAAIVVALITGGFQVVSALIGLG